MAMRNKFVRNEGGWESMSRPWIDTEDLLHVDIEGKENILLKLSSSLSAADTAVIATRSELSLLNVLVAF